MNIEEIKKRMLIPITKEQIDKVLKINSCMKPEHWNKGMYDAFIFGWKLAINSKPKKSDN